jgi:hypothetical protein
VTYFVGPSFEVSFAQGFEYGAVGGVNFKNISNVAVFTQFDLNNNNFSGVFLQININPKDYYFTIGYSLKVGLINGQYISLEPAMEIQHTSLDDKRKFSHSLGFVSGLPSYTFRLWFGDFGQRFWKRPLSFDGRAYRIGQRSLNE